MSQRAAIPETAATPVADPRHPTLWALLATVLPVAVLSWPMLAGRWLIGIPGLNDQGTTGYAWRDWSARYWLSSGHFPLWDAFEFGGIPYVGGQHGDLFYWTSFLRLVLPADTVMNIGFAAHYVIAGMLAYALLRSLKFSWLAAVVGALGYELAGLAISYPAPGHDGKLFVTALLPGALWCINLAIRQRRLGAYAGLALCVGLALLSPHFQMTYYLLVASGLFTLYAAFGGGDDAPRGAERFIAVGVALVAVLLGFGLAGVEILPFLHYLPFSPRATGYSPGAGSGSSFEASTSYAIPWSHIPEFFIAGFTGTTFQNTYWASNPLKLHSEYLGLPVLVLAAFGVVSKQRRALLWWIGGIGLLFLLIALGSDTPFYRLWWLMPYVKQTRAPGMAIYVTALMLAVLSATGVDRLMAGEGKGRRLEMFCLVGGGVLAVLGLTGVLGAIATSMAQGIGETVARQQGFDLLAAAQYYMGVAHADAETIRMSGFIGGLALAAVGALLLARRTGKLPATALLILLPAVIGTDLWRNGLAFWNYQAPARQGLYRTDPIIDYLKRQPLPYRVLELTGLGRAGESFDVYGGAMLMDFGIPQVLGQHSFQINAYNELMGGKNEWRFLLGSRRIWDVDGVEFVLLPAGLDLGSQYPAFANLTADFDTALTATASTGKRAVLYRRKTFVPWARIVPGAIKAPDEQAALYIANPQQPSFLDQLVLLAPDAPIEPPRLTALPVPLASHVTVRSWAAGRMSLAIDPAPAQSAYVVISENWYRDWRVTVDGKPVTPVRGDVAFLTIPVPAGARAIDLHVQADDYETGKKVSLASLGLIALGLIVPGLLRRRTRG